MVEPVLAVAALCGCVVVVIIRCGPGGCCCGRDCPNWSSSVLPRFIVEAFFAKTVCYWPRYLHTRSSRTRSLSPIYAAADLYSIIFSNILQIASHSQSHCVAVTTRVISTFFFLPKSFTHMNGTHQTFSRT
uniref:Putative secreted peptide n=1 Tax=Anopheles braziliensis TaxID=58242 RepID=A0A2M3ZPN3_9DIPT